MYTGCSSSDPKVVLTKLVQVSSPFVPVTKIIYYASAWLFVDRNNVSI